MSFSANAPASATPPPTPATVENDGFFPNIELGTLRQIARIDNTVDDFRLREAIIIAIADVNSQLASWSAPHRDSGNKLADMLPKVGGRGTKHSFYLTAIAGTVKGALCMQWRNIDTTSHADERAEQLENTATHWQQQARWAMSDIQGKPRTTVELI